MTPDSVGELDTCLQKTGLACQHLRDAIHRWEADGGHMPEEQQDHTVTLEEEVAQLRQENTQVLAELHEQRTNHDLLIGDMMRLSDDKQRLLEERDNARFQKSVSELILDQYRDETAEQREVIRSRDADLRDLANTCATLDSEVLSLRKWCVAGGEQPLTGTCEALENDLAVQRTKRSSEPVSGIQDSDAHDDMAAGPEAAAQLKKEKRKRKRMSRKERRRAHARRSC